MKSREQLIDKIRRVADELFNLGIGREITNFSRLPDTDLSEVLESIEAQLERRKKFTGAV